MKRKAKRPDKAKGVIKKRLDALKNNWDTACDKGIEKLNEIPRGVKLMPYIFLGDKDKPRKPTVTDAFYALHEISHMIASMNIRIQELENDRDKRAIAEQDKKEEEISHTLVSIAHDYSINPNIEEANKESEAMTIFAVIDQLQYFDDQGVIVRNIIKGFPDLLKTKAFMQWSLKMTPEKLERIRG